MLARAHGGRLSAFYIALGDAPLARIHYIIGTDPTRRIEPDRAALEAAVVQAARSFTERLGEVLTGERGEAGAGAVLTTWRDAFPPAYREREGATQAAADASEAAASETAEPTPAAPAPVPAEAAAAAPAPAAAAEPSGNGRTFVSPVVARIASEHGVDPTAVPGTGTGGRVTLHCDQR